MLKVEPTDQHGRLATRSGRNVIEVENVRSSISRKPSETKPWLLLNVNSIGSQVT